jgi:radical SAM superfamily enzyme YgiQ (UPF0313 family)
LRHVGKPQRYLGGELNERKKDWAKADCRFLFCFPDVYEVGMSHLGLQILYEAVNRQPGLLMERAFSPWVDMAALMERAGVPLYGLESGRPLGDYDCVGFTLQHEMSYTNVLRMLRQGGLDLWAAERGAAAPLVIAGGPCAANVEPLAPFLDVVILGEGEEILPALLRVIGKYRRAGEGWDPAAKLALLRELALWQGVYVPAFYGPAVGPKLEPGGAAVPVPELGGAAELELALGVTREPGGAAELAPGGAAELAPGGAADVGGGLPFAPPAVIRKTRLTELEGAVFPSRPLVPYMEVVHDRMMTEVLRGCSRGCRFCQAGMIYRPVRERSKETLLAQARALRDNTGHHEISLTSLSTTDHTGIQEIVAELAAEFSQDRISISLPSLRANRFSVSLAEEIQRVRKTGFTFAPEAGSQRLRDAINKGVTEEELLATVSKAVSAGWRQIKLYFMIGLPGETLEDIDAIAALCEKVARAGSEILKARGGGGLRVTCSVSNFVPKAQTPFQWVGQDSQEQLRAKQGRLRQMIKDRRVSYQYHDAYTSMLEAIFARGGRELAPVLAAAMEKGCCFDSWTEQLRRAEWQAAFGEAGWDMEALAGRQFALTAVLPWEHLDYGVNKEFLLREYERSQQALTTGDCRYAGCQGCGVCAEGGAGAEDGAGSAGDEGRASAEGGVSRGRGVGDNRLYGEAVDR